MKIILKLLQLYTPCLIKKWQIQKLVDLSAEAFDCDSPNVMRMSYEKAMLTFAQFTQEQGQKILQEEKKVKIVKQVLREKAYHLGIMLRKILKMSDPKDISCLVRLLYRNIGIELDGCLPGKIEINCCYFKNFYQPEVCNLISSIDCGIIAGLYGGGRLEFKHRLTEGYRSCQAYFYDKEY